MSAKKKGAKRKYGRLASKKVAGAMRKLEKGSLRSGSGQLVETREQAIAIGLSEAAREGGKVPRNPAAKTTAATRKKTSSAKTASAKTRAKKASPKKKAAPKKASPKKKAAPKKKATR